MSGSAQITKVMVILRSRTPRPYKGLGLRWSQPRGANDDKECSAPWTRRDSESALPWTVRQAGVSDRPQGEPPCARAGLPEGSAPPASTNGLKRSAYRAAVVCAFRVVCVVTHRARQWMSAHVRANFDVELPRKESRDASHSTGARTSLP